MKEYLISSRIKEIVLLFSIKENCPIPTLNDEIYLKIVFNFKLNCIKVSKGDL